MAEMAFARRGPLDGVETGQFGRIGPNGPGVSLHVPPPATVLQVLAPLETPAPPAAVRRLAEGHAHALRWVAPGQWFLVLPGEVSRPLPDAGDEAVLVDQSHGRTRILVKGARVRETLAKGIGMDLHPAAFEVGRSASTQFGHIGVHLTRTGEDSFEILVMRGFALSLWQELCEASRGFGYEVSRMGPDGVQVSGYPA